ncbi:MAG: peptidase C11 [Oscillospiraceae bacterium]|nr:peptidase C11 [Oscillospiraceae bacterium]
MENRRPTGRKTNVTGKAKPVRRRGEGLNTGPVGKAGSRPENFGGRTEKVEMSGRPSSGKSIKRGGGAAGVLILILALLFGGNGLFGDSGEMTSVPAATAAVSTAAPRPTSTPKPTSVPKPTSGSAGDTVDFGITPNVAATATPKPASTPKPAVSSAAGATESVSARSKRTQLLGGGRDTVTVMVYMCGADLESRSSMATRDLVEMTQARLSDNVHVIVYTGGSTRWNNSVVSSERNQIYRVQNGGLERLVSDMGTESMTKPSTLTEFIRWTAARYPANRNELILWDHGGGSVSGYGYDERYQRTGSMSLAGLDEALKSAGVSFDFIGFDACLMATLETGLMLDDYADYLIASEETEPGIGWYYTDWLTQLSKNTSLQTPELGKKIADDFVSTCATQTRGQSATLSVVDLAELSAAVPGALKSFSNSLMRMIKNENYQQISTARNNTREFARSSVIDQIDLVHFTKKLGTPEARALADSVLSSVKYNRCSSDMTDAYGLSIYFPYRKAGKVDAACSTYTAIGMDESYADCIRAFASLEVSGQAASGVGAYGLPTILTGGYGSTSAGDIDMISTLLGAFLGGDYSGMSGFSQSNTGFFSGRALSDAETADYIAANSFDPTLLQWSRNSAGDTVISLPESQWDLVESLEYNVFLDDGSGYIDLGLDTVFDFDDDGNLLAPADYSWLALNGQPVAYYHESTTGDGDDAVFRGYIPALLNGTRVELMVIFDSVNPNGSVVGVRAVYPDGETETVAKSDSTPGTAVSTGEDWAAAADTPFWQPGDQLDLLADYYTYAGIYENSYMIGEPMTVTENMELSNVDLGDSSLRMSFRFTDLYQQHYWTPALEG